VAGEGAEGACELGVGNARVAGEVVEGEPGLSVEEAEDAGLADADEQRVVLVRLQLHAPTLPHPLQLPPPVLLLVRLLELPRAAPQRLRHLPPAHCHPRPRARSPHLHAQRHARPLLHPHLL